jgi:hypothetical protein
MVRADEATRFKPGVGQPQGQTKGNKLSEAALRDSVRRF